MIRIKSEDSASMMRRGCTGTRSTKNATPAFSPRASALAAPKKLDPTIRPRATSSAHSTGALNRKRASTEPQTTTRSAASMIAAAASLMETSLAVTRLLRSAGAATDMALTSSLRLADLVHYRFCLGARLEEVVGLRQHALAERFLVAFDDRDALFGDQLQRLAFHRKAVGAGIDGRLLGGIEKALAQFRVHAVERGLAEVGRQRREDVLRQRVMLRGLVELAGQNGRRIVLETIKHAGLQRGVDFAERQRCRGSAHQAQAFGDHRVGERADLEPREFLRGLRRTFREH